MQSLRLQTCYDNDPSQNQLIEYQYFNIIDPIVQGHRVKLKFDSVRICPVFGVAGTIYARLSGSSDGADLQDGNIENKITRDQDIYTMEVTKRRW